MDSEKSDNKKVAAGRKTVARLVAEGRKLFAENGFAATSAEEIVAAAGVTRGALYHHFDGKRGLFAAVVEQVQREIDRRVHARVARERDAIASLIAGNDEFLAACVDPGVRRILLEDAPAVLGWEQWRRVDEANVLGSFKDALRKLREAGLIREVPLDAWAHVISGAANEGAFYISQAADREAALHMVQQVMAGIIETLRPPGAGGGG